MCLSELVSGVVDEMTSSTLKLNGADRTSLVGGGLLLALSFGGFFVLSLFFFLSLYKRTDNGYNNPHILFFYMYISRFQPPGVDIP